MGGDRRAAVGGEGQRVQGSGGVRGDPVVRARTAHGEGDSPGRPDHPLRQVRVREVARALQSRERGRERRGAERHADPGIARQRQGRAVREHHRAASEADQPRRSRALQGPSRAQRRPSVHQQARARPRVEPLDAADDAPPEQPGRQLRGHRRGVRRSELLHQRLLQQRGDRQGRRDRRRVGHRRRARAAHRLVQQRAGRVLRVGRLSDRRARDRHDRRSDRRRHAHRVVPPPRRLSARGDGRAVAAGRICGLLSHAQRLSADDELHHARDARVLRRRDRADRQAARPRARNDATRRIRSADRAREPLRDAARAAQRRVDAGQPVAARPAVHRPRQLQDGQRHARPQRRRHRAADDRVAPVGRRRRRGLARPDRRRRVRRRDEGRRHRTPRGAARRIGDPDVRRAVRRARQLVRAARQHRHRAAHGRERKRDRPAEEGRPRDVQREGRRQELLSVLRAASVAPRRSPDALGTAAARRARRSAAVPRVPAEDRSHAPHHHRLRGAGALGPSRARHHLRERIHFDGRIDRADRADRRLRDPHRVRAARALARRRPRHADARGQHLAGAILARRPDRDDFAGAAGHRHRREPARTRDHRDRDDGISGAGVREDRRAEEARHPHRARRFRHRLLVAVVPAPLLRRYAEGRPLVRAGDPERSQRVRDGVVDRASRALARPDGGRRRHRNRGADRVAVGTRRDRGARLPVLAAGAGRRDPRADRPLRRVRRRVERRRAARRRQHGHLTFRHTRRALRCMPIVSVSDPVV
ncbi:hypothetical protein BVI434_1170004 [Burkholderia vietnamiensis]|nr:hypothetical protein BVI434_1170004 [Burkholderia vietnamiensis]